MINFVELIEKNQFVAGTAIMGLVGGVLYSLKWIPNIIWTKIREKFIHTIKVYQYDDIYYALEIFVLENYESNIKTLEAKSIYFSDTHEAPSSDESSRQTNEKNKIIYSQDEGDYIINYKGKRLVISKIKDKNEKNNAKDLYFKSYKITGFFAKRKIDEMLTESLVKFRETFKKSGTKIFVNDTWGYKEFITNIEPKNIENIYLDTKIKKEILDDLELFNNSESLYLKRSISYKRGYCLHGPPGNGKTSLIASIAKMLNKDIVYVNLSDVESDSALTKLFSNTTENDIIVFEEIDNFFDQRKAAKNVKINYTSLLNNLDGFFFKKGAIIFFTTNNIEKLDPALLRKGRIDKLIRLDNPNNETINEYLNNFFDSKEYNEFDFDHKINMSKIQNISLESLNYEDAIEKIKKEIY